MKKHHISLKAKYKYVVIAYDGNHSLKRPPHATISFGNWAISNKQLGDLHFFTLAQDEKVGDGNVCNKKGLV